MNRWFRMYDAVLDDPKVQKLEPRLFKHWVNLLCVASRNNGAIPPADAAFALRLTDRETAKVMQALISAGLIDNDGVMSPHKWAERQYKSDGSNERVKRFRERQSNGACNVTETVNATGPDTETDNRTEIPPTPLAGGSIKSFGEGRKRRRQNGESQVTPEQQEATRLETLAWAVDKRMINIANNGNQADFRKLIAMGRLKREQVTELLGQDAA